MRVWGKLAIIFLSIFILNCGYEAKANFFSSASKVVTKIFSKTSKHAPIAGVAASKAMKKDEKDKKKKNKYFIFCVDEVTNKL